MNLTPQVKKLCELYDITPSRSKGQNFLITEKIYDDIVQAAELTEDDIVLEVGPGLGFLTAKLGKAVKQVVAVELDDKLSGVLRDGLNLYGVKNVEVVNKDILKVSAKELGLKDREYKIVANLPYNITSIFLRRFLSDEIFKPASMTLMLQKEVAARIIAKPSRPGSSGQANKMSVLAVSVQFYAEPKIIRQVSKGNFWPSPEVDSAIIKLNILNPKHKPGGEAIDDKNFFRLVRHGFSSKRRMLKNNLAGGYKISNEEAETALEAIGLNPKIRAEGLTVENWVELFGEFEKFMV